MLDTFLDCFEFDVLHCELNLAALHTRLLSYQEVVMENRKPGPQYGADYAGHGVIVD